jgi:hypothetical protein
MQTAAHMDHVNSISARSLRDDLLRNCARIGFKP